MIAERRLHIGNGTVLKGTAFSRHDQSLFSQGRKLLCMGTDTVVFNRLLLACKKTLITLLAYSPSRTMYCAYFSSSRKTRERVLNSQCKYSEEK